MNTLEEFNNIFEINEYCRLLDELDCCEKGSDSEFKVYQKLVELCEEEINDYDEFDETDDFDGYIAPMDNLARIYMERKEYVKAVPLLERALPVYRALEINEPDYTYQRYYAMEALVKCYEHIGEKTLSILYGYELKHLKRDVLEARENSRTDKSPPLSDKC